MRKADYLILAKALRERIARYEPAPALNTTHEAHMAALSDSKQAADLARYLADHLSVDKVAFLNACGIRPPAQTRAPM